MISKNKQLYQDIREHLTGVVEMTGQAEHPETAYKTVKAETPDMIFMDMAGAGSEAVPLLGRVRKSLPDSHLFCIGSHKDPDLILKMFRMGITDFLHYPFNGADVSQLVRKAIYKDGQPPGADVIAVFSLKGGVGVTTTAINLADRICRLTSDKVLLLDLNLFMGDIGSYLNIASAYSPYDVIRDMERMDRNLLFSSLYRHHQGFYILTTPEEISDSDSISGEQIQQMVAVLKSYFDYIVIDAPHDFSARTIEMCMAADTLLVLSQQNIPTAKSARKVVEFFRELRFDDKKVKIVLNRYLKTGDMEEGDLAHIFQQTIAFKISNNYPVFAKAAAKGVTLAQAGENSRPDRDMKKMAEKLTGIIARSPKGLSRFLEWRR